MKLYLLVNGEIKNLIIEESSLYIIITFPIEHQFQPKENKKILNRKLRIVDTLVSINDYLILRRTQLE